MAKFKNNRDEVRVEMQKLKDAGKTLTEIATQFKTTGNTVTAILKEGKAKIRSRPFKISPLITEPIPLSYPSSPNMKIIVLQGGAVEVIAALKGIL